MPFGSFTDFLKDVSDKGQSLFAKVKDKATFERTVWACFLIARADGDFSAEEKSAIAKLIQKQLPQFAIDDILGAIGKAEAKLDFDATMGTQEIMADIAKATGDAAETIIQAAVYIGGSDGDFDDNEKAVTRQLCERTGLNPAHYGL